MAAEQSDDWRRQMEHDIEGIARSLQLLLRRVDDNVNVLPSISNPSNPASVRSAPSPSREMPHKPPSTARLIKPASPNEFSDERTKGCSFLNSCELYLNLAPHQFEDEHSKVMWAMSFMKGGCAARFVDRQMRSYQSVGSLPYESWGNFVTEFTSDFCPKNEVQTSRTELETSRYYQGSRTVDEYVDDFREIVDRAHYFEGSHIVLKFRQGLNPKIQDHVACLTSGRPSDELPREWYDAAILCDENRIANEAFRTASRTVAQPETLPASNSMFRRLPAKLPNPPPPISRFAPPIATSSNPSRYIPPAPSASTPSRSNDPSTLVCFRCGQHGHRRPDCPQRFDVRYIDLEERQGFAQEEFVALDVIETKEREGIVATEQREDFGEDNE